MSNEFDGRLWEELPPAYRHVERPREPYPGPANSPEEVFGEIGLVLVVVLGIVVAINMVLLSLHIA